MGQGNSDVANFPEIKQKKLLKIPKLFDYFRISPHFHAMMKDINMSISVAFKLFIIMYLTNCKHDITKKTCAINVSN